MHEDRIAAAVRDPKLVARFLDLVDRSGECWMWTGGLDRFGYGRIGKNILAHRFAWSIANNATPGSMCVIHSCDTPKCVNPKHLRLGTPLDNARDKRMRGRERHPRGEENHSTKLTEAEAIDAIQRARSGETHSSIAKRYGVSPSTISMIANGTNWKHLDRHS
jgi:HNH endonuclease/CENP-B N-terminal DNA-binding domain